MLCFCGNIVPQGREKGKAHKGKDCKRRVSRSGATYFCQIMLCKHSRCYGGIAAEIGC